MFYYIAWFIIILMFVKGSMLCCKQILAERDEKENIFIFELKRHIASFSMVILSLLLSGSMFMLCKIDLVQNGKFLGEPFESNVNIYTEYTINKEK